MGQPDIEPDTERRSRLTRLLTGGQNNFSEIEWVNKEITMNEHVKEVSDASFEEAVLQSKQPVLVDFWAPWCAPCRLIAPMVEAVAEQYREGAAVVKLNVDDNPSTSGRYGIKGIPTLILFHQGTEAERVVGAVSKDALSRMIEKHCGASV